MTFFRVRFTTLTLQIAHCKQSRETFCAAIDGAVNYSHVYYGVHNLKGLMSFSYKFVPLSIVC